MMFVLLLFLTSAASARSFPGYDFGGKSHQQFLTEAIERSSPGNARLLAELFGGLELGLELGGGTKSPCYDSKCKLCYDPLLRIHGKCGGASYFTCRGTLPKACLPYSCTARSGRSTKFGFEFGPDLSSRPSNAVFVKKFPRFQDPFCLGRVERARSLDVKEFTSARKNSTVPLTASAPLITNHPRDDRTLDGPDPSWVMPVPDAVTPCQGYDTCLDLRCGSCYDPYLGAHTSCGKMTYYDCNTNLPMECRPMRCTDTNLKELFPVSTESQKKKGDVNVKDKEDDEDVDDGSPLMVRSFQPLNEANRNCV